METDIAPINKLPSEVFSLIPGYWESDGEDEDLIKMTHVCRSWREMLIACSSLWVCLDCTNIDKTRVYIERFKSSPLELSLPTTYLEDAFLLVAPHIGRLKSLNINGDANLLQNLTPHLSCPIPLLRELVIDILCDPAPVLEDTIFNGDLSSLRSLTLDGVATYLPWNNLSNLTTFKLSFTAEEGEPSIARLLDFFEHAHHLRDITFHHSIPSSSNVPPERVVPLPSLKNLTIIAYPYHTILLDHLSIPVGASLTLEFRFSGDKFPLLDLLPETLGNLKNILPTTSVNICLDRAEKYVRLGGPNGELCMLGHWRDREEVSSLILDHHILRSLTHFDLSGIQRLAITKYGPPTMDEIDRSALRYILLPMEDLRALMLTQCNSKPFIAALDPDQNLSERVLCLKLEELILYIDELESLNVKELLSLAKARASGGAKLSSVTIVGLGELMAGEEVFKLKEYVTRVDFRVEGKPPRWDGVLEGGDN